MATRLTKAWSPLSSAESSLKGQMGVFQLADDSQAVLFIGFAGGKSLHGLRQEVVEVARTIPGATQYRVEVTTAYRTRFRELMMVHYADHEFYPPHNEPINLGRLSPG